MFRTSIFAFIAAAMTFAAEGVNNSVKVNASVDSHINSVTVKAGNQTMTLNKNDSASWTVWYVDTAYSVTATGVDAGYTAKWEVSTNNVVALWGGTNDTINIPSLTSSHNQIQAFNDCALRFFGEPNTYRADLDRQSGSGGPSSVIATNTMAMPLITPPTRLYYTFGGYYTEPDGVGTKYYNADGTSARNWDILRNTTLHAKWTANSHSVTFVLNGGTLKNGWTEHTNYLEHAGLQLPTASDIEKADGGFAGWYLYPSYAGDIQTEIARGQTSDKTFYARWADLTYRVVFDANKGQGGSYQDFMVGMSSYLNSFYSDLMTITPPEGYSFARWNTAADGTGVSYEDHELVYNLTNANNSVTLYAQWTPNAYEVAFNANGADGGETMANQAFVYDVTQNLDHVGFTYAGYAFERWSTDTNYNYQTKYHLDGAAVANLATGGVANLYANWTGIVYTVRFDANGGSGSMDPMTCTYTVPTNLPYCTFARDGWGFKGWTNSLAEGVLFADHARVTNLTTSAEVTLLACWTGVTYAVTLDARDQQGNDKNNGVMTNGTGNAVNVLTNDYTVGDAWILPEPTNLNTHLDFAGWTYGNGQLAGDEVPPPSSGATNLVAKWSRKADVLAAAVDAPPELEFETFGSESNDEKPIRGSLSADWFPQTNDYIYGTNAVQSGALPETGEKVYGSWLTTTVTGKGVLSFSWKCDAKPRVPYEQYGDYSGEFLRFGLFDEAKGITNEIALIEGQTGWQTVTYRNESDSAVSFAWAFVFKDFGDNNGGGTGLVDHVDWKPDGYSGEVTAAHSVPFAWLRDNFPGHDSAGASELETLAEGNSPNGKAWPNGTSVKVWEDYWAGTDPNDPDDLFRALIAVNDGVPSITPYPDMSTSTPERVYWVQGAPIVPARDWARVLWPPDPSDPVMATNRFFKLELDWEESLKK